MNDNKYSLVIGRFQPFHKGHKSLIDTLLAEGKKVCVAIMETPMDKNNPLSFMQRFSSIKKCYDSRVDVQMIPVIDEVCYGRNAGYHIRRVFHEGEDISATEIRGGEALVKPDKAPEFLTAYKTIAEKVHRIAAGQGFWRDGKKRNIAEVIAHAHSELSEAFEYLRLQNEVDKDIKDMRGVEVQLSDVLGLLMDIEVGYGLKISEALLKKMKFNESREYLHGKKF